MIMDDPGNRRSCGTHVATKQAKSRLHPVRRLVIQVKQRMPLCRDFGMTGSQCMRHFAAEAEQSRFWGPPIMKAEEYLLKARQPCL